MHRSTLKWLLALALIVGSAGGVSSIALASDHEHLGDYQVVAKHFFPYVPNGGMIGETGPWHGTITVQNLESETVQVWIMEDGRFDPDQALHEFQLYSHDSETFAVGELELDRAETSLVVMAMYHDIWNNRHSPQGLGALDAFGELDVPKVSATLKQAAGAPMFEDVWTSDAQQILDGYTAIPMNDVGWGELAINCPSLNLNDCGNIDGLENVDGTSYLPLAQSNSGWNTNVYVTNVDGAIDGESMVSVELIPTQDSDNDSTWSEEMRLTPGETWGINVAAAVGDGWTGSVRISSDAGTAAVAARHKPSTNMLLMNTSAPARTPDGSGFRLSAPLVYVDYFGWNTGISLSNQSSSSNTVVVRFYDPEGDEVAETTETIDADGHAFIYLPSEVGAGTQGWIGSAVLESTNARPFHAAVDQVNYDSGAAMSYTLGAIGADHRLGHEPLGLPLLQKSNLNGDGDTTGIQIFNPDPENSVQAEIHLYSGNGGPISLGSGGAVDIDLGPRASYNFYVIDGALSDIPLNTVGSVVVTVTGGSGQIVAVSNMSNNSIQGDGVLVFGLSNGSGQFR